MHVHELRFQSTAGLARALRALVDCPQVEGCVADRDDLLLYFKAPARQAGELIERLHRGGELASWTYRDPALAS